MSPLWRRAALTSVASVAIGVAEWRRPDLPFRIGIRMTEYPVAACDFMAARGIRGRGFNQFYLGGYMLHRFWPDRGRLPFMDIHQAGTPADRYTYSFATHDRRAWRDLDDRHHFDYVVLRRNPYAGDQLLDFLDADTMFASVFQDDGAALFVRRRGPLAAIAETSRYQELPAGPAALAAMGQAVVSDAGMRARVIRELEFEVASSSYHAGALVRLANLAMVEARLDEARALLERALRDDPRAPLAHERLALLALAESRPQEALRELNLERRRGGRFRGYDFRSAQAYQMLGDLGRARAAYRRAVQHDPGNQQAWDSLQATGRQQ